MSKEAYIRGFCKVSEANGYDPFELARMAVGFNRLKKAEAKLFVQELRKKASYTSSQPPVRLTAPNLRRTAPRLVAQSVQPEPEHYGSPGFRGRPSQPKMQSSAASNVQPASQVQTARRPVVSKLPVKSVNPQYDAFAVAAKKKGWNYANGSWTSPSGQTFTDSQVRSRINLRKQEKQYNDRAAARRASGIPAPEVHTQNSPVFGSSTSLHGVPRYSHGVDWGRRWTAGDLLNLDTKSFRRDADAWASKSVKNNTSGLSTFTVPGGASRYW